MNPDDLATLLHHAAADMAIDDAVPIDAIRARHRTLRRRRAMRTSAVGIVVVALAIGGVAALRGPSTATVVNTASGGLPSASNTADGEQVANIPESAHYYKAVVTVTAAGAAIADGDGSRLDAAAGLIGDRALLDDLAERFGMTEDALRHRLATVVRGESLAVDVIAIGTDPHQTELLARAAADALVARAAVAPVTVQMSDSGGARAAVEINRPGFEARWYRYGPPAG